VALAIVGFIVRGSGNTTSITAIVRVFLFATLETAFLAALLLTNITLLFIAFISALGLLLDIAKGSIVGIVISAIVGARRDVTRILDAGAIVGALETLAAGMEATVLGVRTTLDGLLALLVALAIVGVVRVVGILAAIPVIIAALVPALAMAVGKDSIGAVALLVEAGVAALALGVGRAKLGPIVGIVGLGLGLGRWVIVRILDAGAIVGALETLAAGMEATVLGVRTTLDGLLALLVALAIVGVVRVVGILAAIPVIIAALVPALAMAVGKDSIGAVALLVEAGVAALALGVGRAKLGPIVRIDSIVLAIAAVTTVVATFAPAL